MKISKFKDYLLNVILIWIVIYVYKALPYYKNFLRVETQTTILYFGIGYTLMAFIYYLIIPIEKIQKTKGTIIFNFLKKIVFYPFNKEKIEISKHEKTIILFTLVKVFFLPIMLNFFFNNFFSLKNQISDLKDLNSLLTINSFNLILFPLILTLIFMIDTLWFSFGYMFEAGFLKNKIISVEPTFLGWFVALACYPPFNSIIVGQTKWYANDYVLFSTEHLTFIFRILIILFLGIYVWATLALGTKCSNLTNRGIVSRGPYSIIRHPAYISKNLAWWITIIPIISLPAFISMGIWSFIYHLRSITEERHLKIDENYVEYCKKVKYRYIPYIY